LLKERNPRRLSTGFARPPRLATAEGWSNSLIYS
jgi:hypothetical protein